MLIAGIIPLVLFVIVDSFAGLKAGLITAIIAALAEAIFSYFYLGHIDSFTLASIFLVVLLSLASWKMKSALLFKLQPVVIGVGLFLVLYITYFIGEPILYKMMIKYKDLFPQEYLPMIQTPFFVAYTKKATLYFAHCLVIQTALVAYSALKLSNWWWIAIRGLGFYLFLFLASILTRWDLCSNQFSC